MTDSYGRVTARYYDAAYGAMSSLGADLGFYLGLAREAAGPILELGCGTGRALLPIMAEGIPCTGVDESPPMLAALAAKSPPANLRLVQASMQDFDLQPDRFALIFSAFRAFQHMYTVEDHLACLACVRRHLAPGGCFAFDVFNPRLARIAILEEPEEEDLRFELDGDEVVRFASVRREPDLQLQHVHMRYERRRGGKVVSEDYQGDVSRLAHGLLTLTVECEGPDEAIPGSIHLAALQGRGAGLDCDVLHAVDGVRRRHTGAAVVGSDLP